jgi:mannose-6-phosphate isomerase-like protein (cupin superfamily)
MPTRTSSLTGRIPEPDPDLRPSGAVLGIFTLPTVELPVAPFTLARFTVPPGVTSAADCHEVREIWLVQSGAGLITLDGVTDRLVAGEVRYFESFRTHQLHNDGDEPIELVSIWWRP